MIIADTNLIIYSVPAANAALNAWFAKEAPFVSVVSYVEALGYHRHTAEDKLALEKFFARSVMLEIDKQVLMKAIELKQMRRMKLGDALIAATALVHDCTLATHNTADFAWIPNLSLVDPVERNADAE
jgi:predicted nucleic acid-binding protein